jgi:galactokinase
VTLTSSDELEPAVVSLTVDDLAGVQPQWAKYVAGVVAEMHPRSGINGTVTTTIPIGAGLSSSAALEVAVAIALGFEARRCRWSGRSRADDRLRRPDG